MFAAAATRTRICLALVTLALVGAVTMAGVAGGAPRKFDRFAPSAPSNLHVTAATPTAVGVAWNPSRDNFRVVGYYVYVGGKRTTVSRPWYTIANLTCGQSTTVSVVAFDFAGNRSNRVSATVTTAACPDAQAPTTPAGFAQAATTQNAVVLTWAPSQDNVGVVGYGVYRNLARVMSSAQPTVTLTGLKCNSTYNYAVDAADAAGNRSLLGTAFVQTAPCGDQLPPTAPTDLVVVDETKSSVSLDWSPSTDDVGVAGYRVSVGDVPAMTVANTDATVELPCGTSKTLGVEAYDAVGHLSDETTTSASTDPCSAPAPPPVDPTPPPADPAPDTSSPSAPSALAASNITQTSLGLSWTASNDNVGIAGYDVFRNGSKVATVTSTSLSQSALACGTGYVFGVVAFDAAGNRSQQAQTNVATSACSSPPPSSPPPSSPPPPSDTTAPSQPTNLAVSGATRTSVSLTWVASTDNVGVTGYGAYVNGSAGPTSTQPQTTVSSLTCGTAYTFAVDASDAAGNRSTKASVVGSTAACADTQAPSAPTNLVATSRTATSIALSWTASTDNVGVSGYGLYRSGSQTGTTATPSTIFSGLTCNTNYTLAVDAADAAGNRSGQTVVMVSTTACPDTTPPSAPANLAASNVSASGLTLNWSASTDNVGVAGYDVYRNGTKMTTVSSTSSSQTSLACGTSYSFAVVARDAAGNSSTQATKSASTSACAPPPSSPPPSSPPPSSPPPPSTGGFPDASNTGVPSGTTLTPSGSVTIGTAGTVISGLDITGSVTVNAPNVTIRNTRIRSNSMWVIQNNSTGLLVEDSEIINRPVSGQNNCHNAIGSANFTVVRTEITGCENGMNVGAPGNITFTDNYVHDLDITGPSYVFGSSPHTDGIQFPFGGASNIVIRHNTIDPVSGSDGATSAIIMTGENGPESSVWIEDNYIDGRGASVAIYAPRVQTHDVYINRNHMYKGVYGQYTFCVKLGTTVTEFNGNVDAGTNAAISPDNGVGGGCTN